MTSVGHLLRDARESQGRAIAEMAEELCLTQRYLRAIEEDDLAYFPGAFFYKSFVRQYAALLGVDRSRLEPLLTPISDATVAGDVGSSRQVQSAAGPAAIRAVDPIVEETNRPYFPRLRTKWAVAALAVMLAACSGFYGWWTRAPEPSPQPPDTVEQPSAAALVPPTQESDPAPLVLTLSATERTWLSITAGGREIFSGTLRPSESKTLSGVEAATVKVGNAAGIEIRWQGKPLGPIGARGEVRTVLLTPQSFEILDPPRS